MLAAPNERLLDVVFVYAPVRRPSDSRQSGWVSGIAGQSPDRAERTRRGPKRRGARLTRTEKKRRSLDASAF